MIANVEDARRIARRRLPKFVFDYLDSGAFGETTLRANVADFARLRLRQRVLADVSERSLATTVLGKTWPLPFMLGPVGSCGLFAPHGDMLAARAAHAAELRFCLSNFSVASLQELRAATSGPLWLQINLLKDRSISEALIARAENLGVEALVLTVDTAVSGVRENDIRNGYRSLSRIDGRIAMQLLMRPLWCLRMAGAGMPVLGNLADRPELGRGILQQSSRLGPLIDASVRWEDAAALRKRWRGLFVIKGISDPEDALRAADIGADAIVVSNHGGRQLDGAPSTLAVLPEIVAAVGTRTEVLIDGGVRRGSDLLKALALGARGVLLGRAYAYGLAAGGEAGVKHIIALLAAELDVTMALCGLTSIPQVAERGAAVFARST